MGRKIFVSYKHSDASVQPLNNYYSGTARDYVDYLINKTLNTDIYKGEGNENLSEFKNNTIATHLKKKIHDSSVTIVLISPNMKNRHTPESDQWIPWEIAYSLKEITRSDQTSQTNGVLAVVLPDTGGCYNYFIEPLSCGCTLYKTNILFSILKENMFNSMNLQNGQCNSCTSYSGDSSYISLVKWCDFINDKEKYINKATEIRDKKGHYNITKEIR